MKSGLQGIKNFEKVLNSLKIVVKQKENENMAFS